MNGNHRNRHCFATKDGDQVRYFAVYGKITVEIQKDVFDCLWESYSREWQLEKIERKHKKMSIDQIIDDISQTERHGTIPDELLSPSAENIFMENCARKSHFLFLHRFMEKIADLPTEDRQVLMTFLQGSSEVSSTAKTLGIAERTVYYRRVCLAKKISVQLKKEYGK